jgi:hypothetical protein
LEFPEQEDVRRLGPEELDSMGWLPADHDFANGPLKERLEGFKWQ